MALLAVSVGIIFFAAVLWLGPRSSQCELIEFIHHPNPGLRKLAIKGLLPYTIRSTKVSSTTHRDEKVEKVYDVRRFAEDEDRLVIGHDALSALINLTDLQKVVEKVSDPGFLEFLITRIILDPDSILADLGCMLLSNLTKIETVIAKLLSLSNLKSYITSKPKLLDLIQASSDSDSDDKHTKKPSWMWIDFLVEVFCRSDQFNSNSNFHFLASVWANFSSCLLGRNYLISLNEEHISSTDTPLFQLLPFTQHPNLIRRGGVISCIKNCCFTIEAHRGLLDPKKLNVLPPILIPLIGPEPFEDPADELDFPSECQFLNTESKLREPDPNLRLILIEALILLASLSAQRNYLRDKKVYRIIQVLHLNENDEKVQEAVERLVNLLMRDDSEENENKPEKKFASVKEEKVVDEDENQLTEV
ncbi:hypothetical protein PPACK8108_LOCUS19142 [Phakopsora pachyrhizi]|uniref:Protein HGH1 homolog n=1 Tax=Phakopsora pachyrhizi TaxID=170000 RepID=A0AAV0BC28_PHAPC|nr:hypothetical protein PPACK8108_LOCUS19142 [Phakopsora pachyrhizi]